MKANFKERRRADVAAPANFIEKRGVHVAEVPGHLWETLHQAEVTPDSCLDQPPIEHPDWAVTDVMETRFTAEEATAMPPDPESSGKPAPEILRQQAHLARGIVACHHPQIGAAISILWGHAEYSYHVSNLILDGHDSTGSTRTPLHHDAVDAMKGLIHLHHQLYGSPGGGAVDRVNRAR